jgi:hypothetical protein
VLGKLKATDKSNEIGHPGTAGDRDGLRWHRSEIGDKNSYVLSLNQACDLRYTPIYLPTNDPAGSTGVKEVGENNKCRGSDCVP